jgi:hypothetical protein
MKVSSLADLERDWTIDSIADAHHWLDELDRAEVEGRRRAKMMEGAI